MKLRCTIITLFLSCTLSILSKTYVVCVGIADYPGKENDLRISDNDAKTIAKVFEATKDASARVLLNEEATQSALLSTMHTLFAEAQKEDAILLYFSGHGTPGALFCYDGLLSYQYIFKMLKGCKATRKIIIADACFSGRCEQVRNSQIVTMLKVLCFFYPLAPMRYRWRHSIRTVFLPSIWNGVCEEEPIWMETAGLLPARYLISYMMVW